MKNPRHFLLYCLLMLPGAASIYAQSEGFAYQAVARDLNGNLLANQTVNVRMVLRAASATGIIIYEETHTPTTNDFGLMTLIIGAGTTVSGNFGSVDWSPANIFLDVQINGVSVSNEQLRSVPYSKTATNMSLSDLTDVGSLSPANNEVLKFNGTEWVSAADAVNDADASPTNEIQTLSLSGINLSLSNGGGSVSLPAGTIYSAGAGLSLTGSTFSALDVSPTNEIQTLSLSGSNLSLSNGGGSVSLPAGTTYSAGSGLTLSGSTFSALDVSPTNEIQTLSLSGNTLSLSNGGSVALPTGTPSQWTTAGANIHYTAGNVGIGDATPAATLTVGNGDKFQVVGADGDVLFTDPQASIRFPSVTSASAPMIQMFSTGTQNADRMIVAHSPGFPTWGLQYRDTTDVMFIRNNNTRHVAFELTTGHVGIGIEDPAFPLDILGRMRLRSTGSINNSPGIWFSSLNNNFDRAFIGMSAPDSVIGIYSQHMGKWAIEFEVMREPRIGINIAAGSPPRAELHVRHTNFGGSNDGIRIQNEGSNNHYWNLYTSNTTGSFEFFFRGIKRATIDDVTGAYAAISDARLKGDVRPLGEVMSRVLQLKPSQYHYLSDSTQKRYTGVIAQELETIFPEFVYFGGDDQVFYTVDYAGLSVIALKGLQEQQTLIQQLQEELDAQKQRNDALERRLLLLEKRLGATAID